MLPQIQTSSLSQRPRPHRELLIPEPAFRLNLASDKREPARRPTWKRFIHQVFERAYAADVKSYYPCLYGISDARGDTMAVAGVRAGAGQRLFAEQYLDQPVEQMLSARLHTLVDRDGLVEVGNLAPAGPGQARWLIMTVTALLHHAGYRHVVFTAVPALYNAFRRMGLQPVALGRADPVRLGPGSRDDWGAYYRMEPMVYGGDIAHGYQHIESSLSMSQPHLISLWRQAAELGRDDHRVYCPWRLPNGRVIQ